jgi:hypothetical protein
MGSGYVRAVATNTCTPNTEGNTYYYNVTCGGTGPTTTTTSTSTSSTTTTSTTVLATVFMDPRNSLSGTSYTPYINGIADPSWDSGSRSYPLGTTIRVDYSSPACNVTLNGSAYSSGTTITLSTTGSRTFTLLNADHWVNNGGTTCAGNELRQPIINDCGATSYNVISYCSCDCNVTCGGTYWGGWYCENNETKRNQYYNCNGTFTGVTETNPNCTVACTSTYWYDTCDSAKTLTRTQKYSCNNANTGVVETYPCNVGTCGASTTQVWSDTGDPYCITGSCTLRQLQTQTNQCAAGYGSTRTIDTGTASSSCGTNYWDYYCVNYGVAPYEYRRREVNTCTGNTGVDQFVSYNATECGYYSPLPSFSISVGVGDSGFACTRTIGNIAYCAGGNPTVSTMVYANDNGTGPLATGFYHINVSGDEYIEILNGQVVDRGPC